ncbi:MAG: FAD-dependent oxidoreductase, partial [Candidatus Dormibacteraceae bacterium]
ASLMLWANALGALNRYRVFDAIKQNSDPLNQGLYYDPKGILLSPEGYAPILNGYGYPPLIIHRAKLNQILAAHLGANHILVNAKFVGYTEGPDGIEVRFADGTVIRADLLIGADRVHSKVRGRLIPDVCVTEDKGHVAWRAVIPPADILLGAEAFVIGHRRTRGGWLRTGNGLLFWSIAQFIAGDTGTGTTRKDEVLARIDALDEGGWNFPLRRLVEATPESKILRDAILVVPTLPRWTSARVALVVTPLTRCRHTWCPARPWG